MATNQPVAFSNWVAQKAGIHLPVADPNDPVEKEYQRLLVEDDQALEEIDRWIKENQKDPFADDPLKKTLLQERIDKRVKTVRAAYEDFLKRHPGHSAARVAFGSFLHDVQEEDAAREQWEKALALSPANPAIWNNLANIYGHNGPVEKAFEYYDKAIELESSQPLYYQNLATTVYMFRKNASRYYQLPLPEVLEKAMALYKNALDLDPKNFVLASEIAQTFYGIPPQKTGDPQADRQAALDHAKRALAAWEYALALARDDIERQGIYLHLARVHLSVDQRQEAETFLKRVTDPMYNVVRSNLWKKLETPPPADAKAASPAPNAQPATP